MTYTAADIPTLVRQMLARAESARARGLLQAAERIEQTALELHDDYLARRLGQR